LSEAASLIARKLASADPAKYSDEGSALDDARSQLVRALFDGAIYSEGVRWRGDPGPDDPSEPPPIPEPDKWEPIDAGWWSHERYEQYVYRPTEFELLLLRPELVSDKENLRLELIEQIVVGANLLDKIIVSWNGNSFDVEGFEGDNGFGRIRVARADIEAHFAIEAAELHSEKIAPPVEAPASFEIGKLPETSTAPKRKTKPDRVRRDVHAWLDKRFQEKGQHWIKSKFNTTLSRLHAKTLPSPPGDLGHVRKIMASWRKERRLTR
jgi:hypothetical protein